MATVAVPEYLSKLGASFYETAPPGHRFSLYLRAWGENQETGKVDWRTKDRVPKLDSRTKQIKINQRTGQTEYEDVPNDLLAFQIAAGAVPSQRYEDVARKNLPTKDEGLKPWRPLVEGLKERQQTLASSLPADCMLSLQAEAIAPFTTGLGNEHPLENGFAFLNPYGLPYLPGSGVKGVLRKAAQELEKGLFGGKAGWTPGAIEALFGRESDSHDTEHQRGALMFWDVIPQIKGDSLKVEVMTPHQGHYYQKGESPHESGSPNPINFLTVPPGSSFTFHIQCNRHFLARIAPELANDGRWKPLLEAAFAHAFEWLSFGAKTRVGYGSMLDRTAEFARQRGIEREERERLRRAESERAAQLEAEQLRKAALSPAQLEIEELESVLRERLWQGPRSISLPHQKPYQLLEGLLKRALAADSTWSAPERQALAQLLKDLTAVSPPRLSDNSKLGKDAKKLINQLLAARA